MKLIIWVAIAVVGLVVAVVALVAAFGPGAGGGAGTGVEVWVETVAAADLTETIGAPGKIEPRKNVSISARLSARIVELPFDAGDKVKVDDVLVRLDASELEASVRSREAQRAAQASQLESSRHMLARQRADLKRIAASLKDAERDLERQRQLIASGDIAQSDLDDVQLRRDEVLAQRDSVEAALRAAERDIEVATHRLDAADAEIAQARENLEYTVIRSPIEGVVTVLNAEVGELVVTGTMNNAGTVIMEVADLSRMLMVAEVDEADIGKIELGQRAQVRTPAFEDHVFEGVVESVALSATQQRAAQSTHFMTEISLETDGQRVLGGLTADAEIDVAKHQRVITVPSQAVLARPIEDLPDEAADSPNVDKDKTLALVVYRLIDGKAKVTPVQIGPSDLTHTVIAAGLEEGDDVITGPFKVLDQLKHDKAAHAKEDGDAKEADDEPSAEDEEPGPADRPVSEPVG